MNSRLLTRIVALAVALTALNCATTSTMEIGEEPAAGMDKPAMATESQAPATAEAAPATMAAITLEVESFAIDGATITDHADASGGKAAVFGGTSGKAETSVELEAGKYEVTLYVFAEDGDQDATYLAVNNGTPNRLYPESWGELVPCSQTVRLNVEAAGPQTITLKPAETNVLLDKVTIIKKM